jgi:predicted flavoprotein YhiN
MSQSSSNIRQFPKDPARAQRLAEREAEREGQEELEAWRRHREKQPASLAHALAETCLPPGPMANVPDRTLVAFAARLNRWEFQPTGSEGWSKAEVTLGGIDTRDLSSKTMEARDVPGLYAIGEALDVTGWLGGYNFQWAWSSGWGAVANVGWNYRA